MHDQDMHHQAHMTGMLPGLNFTDNVIKVVQAYLSQNAVPLEKVAEVFAVFRNEVRATDQGESAASYLPPSYYGGAMHALPGHALPGHALPSHPLPGHVAPSMPQQMPQQMNNQALTMAQLSPAHQLRHQLSPARQLTPQEIRNSKKPHGLVCFEDNKIYKSLKRHLSGLGLTPEAYREKWGLPLDYPMVCEDYSKQRSELAKDMGLGKQRKSDGKSDGKSAAKKH